MRIPVALLGLAFVACEGQIVTPLKVIPAEGGEDNTPCEPAPARVVARRLTRVEYHNTLRDLFTFDVGNPEATLPEDVAGGDLQNSTGLTVSDLFLEKLEGISEKLAQTAVEKGFAACGGTVGPQLACARDALAPFIARAWRRPVTDEELASVLKSFEIVATQKSEPKPHARAVALAIQRVLMSPNFLFRFEVVGDPTSPTAQRLGAYDIASRLSYFIYGSMPDPQLLASAASGRLLDPAEIALQVTRMLEAPQASYLYERIAGDWLWADRVDVVNPKGDTFPTFTPSVRQGMKRETALFVQDFVKSGRDFRDMLDADFTFVNAELAHHYGLPTAGLGTAFSRVALAGSRGGLLTQGSVLAATSAPFNMPDAEIVETNVIIRGKYVLTNLLCGNVPEPPANLDIAAIQAEAAQNVPAGAPRKEREGVRTKMDPCRNCHSFMDPVGFSMEHFDVTGAWRDVDSMNTAVDSTGVLKNSEGDAIGSFDGVRSLATLLKTDARFTRCTTKAMYQLVVGRFMPDAEACRTKALAARAEQQNFNLKDLIISLTQDEDFLSQAGEAP